MSRAGAILAALVALAALLVSARDAGACANEVMLDLDARIAKLRDAQRALDDDDVETARELATEAARHAEGAEGAVDIRGRAERIVALSRVRDASSTASEQEEAADTLASLRQRRAIDDPSLTADYAEAAARVPSREDEAFALLAGLARRDLLGSAYAHGALFRLARERGDDSLAKIARERCEAMYGASSACRGAHARAPLVRGRPIGYALPAGIFLAALLFRLVRARRARPWFGHAARLQTAAIAGAGLYAFARATSPWWSAFVVSTIVALTFVVERRGFFALVRRGKIPGLALRPAGPEDEHLPPVALWLGPSAPETLERVVEAPEPSYRDAAVPSPAPLLRLVSRRAPRALVVAAVLTLALALLALLSLVTLRAA
ncbi:MAG: hypothetical protein KF819_39920 [Labilithrix sp.]|nr:hypothetical protein [Labilithrix sp.]